MGQELDSVRVELGGRIAAMRRRAGTARRGDLACEVDAIRLIAHRAGLAPAVTVTHLLDSALADGHAGALVQDWLAVLDEAVRSERTDPQACATFAAACQVRINH